jgi:hypothetical protein
MKGWERKEIENSLEEFKFGVEKIYVDEFNKIKIKTLEGEEFNVELTLRGFVKQEGKGEKVFETLNSLLMNVSPKYVDKFNESLFNALTNIEDKE